MNKIINYLVECFGNKNLSNYPGLFKKVQLHNLDSEIILASFSVLYDTANEPRSIDWRAL